MVTGQRIQPIRVKGDRPLWEVHNPSVEGSQGEGDNPIRVNVYIPSVDVYIPSGRGIQYTTDPPGRK